MEQVRNYYGKQLRVIDTDGVVWFAAQDVAAILDHSNNRAMVENLDGVRLMQATTASGTQHLQFVNEAALIRLLTRSQKPECDRFLWWVWNECVPAVRRTTRTRQRQVVSEMTRLVAELGEIMTA
jgi:prophage antirepressor-like protein